MQYCRCILCAVRLSAAAGQIQKGGFADELAEQDCARHFKTLPYHQVRAYLERMDDSNTPRRSPATWIEAMEEGEADLAAGRVFDFAEVMAEFEREDEAELAKATARAKPRRRTAEA